MIQGRLGHCFVLLVTNDNGNDMSFVEQPTSVSIQPLL